MSPGELATFLAFYRELYRLDWHVFVSSALEPGHPENSAVVDALGAVDFWDMAADQRAKNLAAIDRAILAAEAKEQP